MHIYKIFRADEMASFVASGQTDGAPIDIEDGYIHFSTAQTVAATAAKYFAGEDGLVLLTLDADALGADLRWEPARGGVLFPHLYRMLVKDDVIAVAELLLGPDGHVFPDHLA
ncbi:MAG: DUF952 domain-containing protein [Pseudomonadota bacterium]